MPTVKFNPTVNSSPATLISLFDTAGAGTATLLTATELDVTVGSLTFVFTGTGLTYNGNQVTGGIMTGLEVVQSGVSQVTMTGFNLHAAFVQTTVLQDVTGAAPKGIEKMLLPLAWTYNGNSNADILLTTTKSADGVLLNFSGRDIFNLNGGNDHVFMGNGNDRGNGGSGNDTIEGGNGNDILIGGIGNDSLDGGAQADKISGGAGADVLTGGTGIDTFIFAQHDGADSIIDLHVLEDKIDLPTGVAHHFTSSAAGTILHYGSVGDTVLLTGVDLAHAAMITFI